MGADVYIIDVDPRKLEYLDDIYGNRITTIISNEENILYSVVNSHLVIGAVLITGARAPRLVTESMVAAMKPGAVIVDVAIDQGGCVETSTPTTHQQPTFSVHDVIHYCVPNMPGAVARTSTFALTNVTLPYAVKLADQGFRQAVSADGSLARGVNLYKGIVTYEHVASALDLPVQGAGGSPNNLDQFKQVAPFRIISSVKGTLYGTNLAGILCSRRSCACRFFGHQPVRRSE